MEPAVRQSKVRNPPLLWLRKRLDAYRGPELLPQERNRAVWEKKYPPLMKCSAFSFSSLFSRYILLQLTDFFLNCFFSLTLLICFLTHYFPSFFFLKGSLPAYLLYSTLTKLDRNYKGKEVLT